MRLRSHGLSDIGRKRKTNEDSLFLDDDLGLYIVADGMGGHEAGEVASAEAVAAIYSIVQRGRPIIDRFVSGPDPQRQASVVRLIESSVQSATYMIYGLAELAPEQAGMGTTASVLLCAGTLGVTAQVGDSRVYQVRAGKTRQITEDHTLINWQLKEGLITEEEAALSPNRNVITRAVGDRDYVEVDTRAFEIESADRYLLCSGGLHG